MASESESSSRALRRVALLLPAACAVPGLLESLQTYLQSQVGGGAVQWSFVAFQFGEWAILGALTPMVYALTRRFPLRRGALRRNVAIHACGALLLCVCWAASGVALRALLGLLPTDVPLWQHTASWMLTSLPWSVFIYFTVVGCVLAFVYFFEASERAALTARLSAQVAEARLSALRSQLHPHFLFNSLNAVNVLIRDGRTGDATRVVELLSEVLRHVMGNGREEVVSLEHELHFVRRYLEIELVRFSDRLQLHWDLDPGALSATVPSLILQPLVENAVRHGIAQQSESSDIAIRAKIDGDVLVVEVANAIPAKVAEGNGDKGSGIGLQNVRERLAVMFGDRGTLETHQSHGRFSARLRVPQQKEHVS